MVLMLSAIAAISDAHSTTVDAGSLITTRRFLMPKLGARFRAITGGGLICVDVEIYCSIIL